MAGETRANPRFALEAAIEIRYDGAVARGRTTNLSHGGFSAVVDRDPGRGAAVEVHISLVFSEDSFSEPLLLSARVVWATALGPARHQLGAQFARLDDHQRSYLDMFLRYLADDATGDDDGDDPAIADDPFAS